MMKVHYKVTIRWAKLLEEVRISFGILNIFEDPRKTTFGKKKSL
jgi:hypothetical protein